MFQNSGRKIESSSSRGIDGFSEREGLILFRAGSVRSVESGESIIRGGESNGGLILILDGVFSVMVGDGNRRVEVYQTGLGDVFDCSLPQAEGDNLFSIVARSPSRVLEIDHLALDLIPADLRVSLHRKMSTTLLTILKLSAKISGCLLAKVDGLAEVARSIYDEGKEEYAQSAVVQEMIGSFPRLPIQINRLTSMLLDEGASVSEIVGFAKMDPSIVSAVLKTVNSGYYNFQRKISDFHHAFVLLGFNQVYQILMDNFLRGVVPKNFDLRAMNLHSALISQIAFDLSQLAKRSRPVMMSTLGILHDLGKCVILVSKAKKPGFGVQMSAPKIGALLLDAWKTPTVVCRSVEHQEYPNFCSPSQVPEDCRDEVSLLFVAHRCFEYLTGGKVHTMSQKVFEHDYMEFLGLNNYSLENLLNRTILPSLLKKMDVLPDYVRDFIVTHCQTAAISQPAR